MKLVACYSTARKDVPQSFEGVKRVTVPGQSMSLREIVRRYVRREAMPVGVTEGVYETRFGDLEKISKMDLVEQHEHIQSLKDAIKAFEVRSEKEENERKASEEKELFAKAKAEAIKEMQKTFADAAPPGAAK